MNVNKDGIFLIRQGELVVLEQRPYESEALLQRALASFPAVLAGSTTGDAAPKQLLLIRREMGVPKTEGGGSAWSLDHLFVDSDGVPVIVEVKRSADTRIRREVVGQILDYAANAVRYWPVADLRKALRATTLPPIPATKSPVSFTYAEIGINLSQAIDGGFVENPPGHWRALKLFFGEGDSEAQVFLNINPQAGKGQFSMKDPDYGDAILIELVKAL